MKLSLALGWTRWESKCFVLSVFYLLQILWNVAIISILLACIVIYSLSVRDSFREYKELASDPRGVLTITTSALDFIRTRESISQTRSRLRTLFGLGWFFEWPGGRHPLNTTWPWADVKPSLVVLWGVCWMFALDPRARVNMAFDTRSRKKPVNNAGQDIPYTRQPNRYMSHQEASQQVSKIHQFEQSQRFGTASPVIKTEVGEPRYSPALPHDRAFEASHLYTQLAQQPARRFFQDQADTIAPRTTPAAVTAERSAEVSYLDAANTNAREFPTTNGASHTTAPQANLVSSVGVHRNYNFNQHNVAGYPRNHRHHVLEQDPQHFAVFDPYQYPLTSSVYSNPNAMALQYERQQFPVDYPQSAMMHNPHQDQEDMHQRYPSPPPPLSDNPYNHQTMDAATALTIEGMPELPQKEESDAPSPGRSKPIPKPDREVTKGEDGRFICTWPGCTEDMRSFGRKCEWSKHMDKHDRPYKCPTEGCEKLPGFTYSGGLLRHQREVHNLHGGPRKQLNCPHPNCKRYSGKGFSRQENLNEHLRRVHTDGAGEVQDGAETEEDGSERTGMKRKRAATESPDIRQEVAKLRKENEKLKRQAEQQNARTNDLLQQVQALQSIVGVHALPQAQLQAQQQAPQANMTGLQSM